MRKRSPTVHDGGGRLRAVYELIILTKLRHVPQSGNLSDPVGFFQGEPLSKYGHRSSVSAMSMSTAEVAKHLQVSRRTVHRMVGRGELPAVKLPGRTGAYVFDRHVVAAIVVGRVRPRTVMFTGD